MITKQTEGTVDFHDMQSRICTEKSTYRFKIFGITIFKRVTDVVSTIPSHKNNNVGFKEHKS